ncbi:hypothetical protein CLAFUW4_06799 [Fulvia fulva]|uniref:BTB domain-containing protein n=1 Tax=Passalora fulva TaxID=5499 RepID=A0A9Q8PB60_PASFU|nr:uncharacterized protein CLAFUR5_06936 [Fulvia fulva]KAK4621991.1 hypothetical protein CLAFUR4_06807 [Fulvia fulva]KAK4623513.1 hypothetical protein CLAFUR0_06802 [Fulvia fulva]UJO19250.1 hypothetical protein CLAFUR5_06936 [Fulvia fulva]WPV15924.1 hypothetical protein CLAFUW4_06799 [Fulvia fulva]WPV31686.1 hypothetical protein CLAFUW7_06798 [Fulvia fulva]
MEEISKSIDAYLEDELVTIALDNCSRTFTISKALLCGASDYFVKALNGRFKEAADHILRLPGCDEATLRCFVYYLTHDKELPDLEAR